MLNKPIEPDVKGSTGFPQRPLRYLSVCSGIEAASVAWCELGWKAVAFAEIDPFASAVLAHRFHNTPNLGDFTKIESADVGPIDLLVGGTPCFPSHVVIATKRGFIPISQVRVGDEVLTHENRWRRVLRTGSKLADTVILRGQGLSDGLHTTPDHPIYARSMSRPWVGRENGSRRKEFSDPQWTPASSMRGMFWASPIKWPRSVVPPIQHEGNERPLPPVGSSMMRLIGRWLGDGWLRFQENRRAYVLICAGRHEADDVAAIIAATGLHASRSDERTTVRFQIASKAFAKWLREHFGSGARNKTIPTWVLGLDRGLRESLLDGYLSADGCIVSNGRRLTTVSRWLALGTTMLAHSLGQSASRSRSTVDRRCVIEGREVHEESSYQITLYDHARSSVEIGEHRWGLVRKVEVAGREVVYDLEVEEDHSYVADGIFVHNCQSFSVAGRRAGLDDPRGNLAIEFCRLARRVRPRWLVWENVVGVHSSWSGAPEGEDGEWDEDSDFGAFLDALEICGYSACWRVLDAQYCRVESHPRAVPQRRERIFLVGYLGDWRPPAAVLLEPEGLRGDTPPRRQARQAIAGSLGAGSKRSGSRVGRREAAANHLVAHDITTRTGNASRQAGANGNLVSLNGLDGAAHALNGRHTRAGRLEPHSETFVAIQDARGLDKAQNGAGWSEEGSAYTVDSKATQAIAFDTRQITNPDNRSRPELGDPCHPLHTHGGHAPAIAVADPISAHEGKTYTHEGKTGLRMRNVVPEAWAVRRLTPLEAERLQGFPDFWTLIPYRGGLAKDGPRYRALGNSFAVNCISWIGQRIALFEEVRRG